MYLWLSLAAILLPCVSTMVAAYWQIRSANKSAHSTLDEVKIASNSARIPHSSHYQVKRQRTLSKWMNSLGLGAIALSIFLIAFIFVRTASDPVTPEMIDVSFFALVISTCVGVAIVAGFSILHSSTLDTIETMVETEVLLVNITETLTSAINELIDIQDNPN